MTKVLFVTPPVSSKAQYGYLEKGSNNIAPLGILSIAAYMREKGYDVEAIDAEAHKYSFDETVDMIIASKPDFVGTTSVSLTAPVAAYLAEKIHKKNPDIPVILGGIHMSSLPKETLEKYPNIDIGVIGEGEITFYKLIKALEKGESIEQLDGIAFRKNGDIIVNKRRSEIEDLDVLPIPAWDLLDAFPHLYTPPAHCFGRTPVAHIVAMRGCEYKCIFCSKKAFPNKARFFSAEYVIDMLKYLIDNFGIKELKYYDDNIMKNKPRFRKLCQMMIDEKLDLTWTCSSRVDLVDLESLKLAKKAGCWQIFYGIESGDPEILKKMRKGITVEKIKEGIKTAKEAGIQIRGYFICGFPGETEESLQRTIDLALTQPIDDFQMTYFTPLPGSPISEVAHKWGTFEDDWSKMNKLYPIFIPNGWTKEKLEKMYNRGLMRFYLRPRIIYKYLLRMFKSKEAFKVIFSNALNTMKFWFFVRNQDEVFKDGWHNFDPNKIEQSQVATQSSEKS